MLSKEYKRKAMKKLEDLTAEEIVKILKEIGSEQETIIQNETIELKSDIGNYCFVDEKEEDSIYFSGDYVA